MNEITHIPPSPLNQFIDIMWVGKARELNLQSEDHAPLFTELIFNYGEQFQVKGQNVFNNIHKYNRYTISGLKTAPFQTLVSGKYCTVGLILKPFCYGILIHKLGTDSMATVSNVLFDYLIESPIPNFKMVEHHLLQLFQGAGIDRDLLKFENHVSAAFLQKGALKNFNLSLPISQKSFIRKFKKNYLLTPGEFIKLKQVNYAIQLLKKAGKANLTHIGLDAGFYDQAHFIRVFKQFCGVTPGQFRKVNVNH
ncbi:helix-turn-helix domain-containing protein [Fulvivirgaceae bacterium BMA12]|uniref:Helix-turn-helix domain-containing protein n=1 Tax=Agaribacillus aureus TaxID=3051825 RepID=A0ABT8LGU8_9BACT|nr:helix-turn-helix domain-containing protein [Fulvivirgaceae bacterium BMA12]